MPDETPKNHCMFQGFEWNVPADQKHWLRLQAVLEDLKNIGIDNIWLPPACKGAAGGDANGYDVYDLYDIGEFDQKGSRSTKWGPREDLDRLADKAQELGVGLYFDAVLNHKAGADRQEKCTVVEVNQDDRNNEIASPHEISAWLAFDFPGRHPTYSSQKYSWPHFSGTDYDAGADKTGIYRILGDNKHWSHTVGSESGNADFLMFADVDYAHPEVIADVIHWGEWITRQLKLKGFRLDACQHFSERFTNEFTSHLHKTFGRDTLFLVGEFWTGNLPELHEYLDNLHHANFSLYDSPLLNNFATISSTPDADLRTVFENTLVATRPSNAVTLVMNHDTQPGQTMDTPIADFFKPLAYALILLRAEGYPCVFYGDLYGLKGPKPQGPSCAGKLPKLILARTLFAYGEQDEYVGDEPNCIAFVRRGTNDRKAGLACIMSNAGAEEKKMAVGTEHKGEVWTDLLGWQEEEVTIDDDGYGVFKCAPTSVSVWVNKDAEGRGSVDELGFDEDIYARA